MPLKKKVCVYLDREKMQQFWKVQRLFQKIMSAVISILSIVLLTALDQIIKYFVELNLKPVQSISVLNNVLEWDYVQNTGAAFGAFSEKTTLLSVITGIIIIIGIAALVAKKIKNKYLAVTAVMIIAGGLGNLVDRIWRGYVVDYIRVLFIDFPVFNFADILVTCGAAMLMIYLLWDINNDRKKKKAEEKKNG